LLSSDFRRLPRVVLALVALAAAAALTAWGMGAIGLRAPVGPQAGPAAPGAGPAESPVPPPPAGPRVEAGTELIFDAAGRCRRVQGWREPAGAGRAGLDRDGLEAALPGWRVASFAADKVLLVPRDPAGDCPDSRPFTLAIRDGEVVILAGAGLDGPVQERPGIAAALLAPGDLAVLFNGHTVQGLDRAWEYLEGIVEHHGP